MSGKQSRHSRRHRSRSRAKHNTVEDERVDPMSARPWIYLAVGILGAVIAAPLSIWFIIRPPDFVKQASSDYQFLFTLLGPLTVVSFILLTLYAVSRLAKQRKEVRRMRRAKIARRRYRTGTHKTTKVRTAVEPKVELVQPKNTTVKRKKSQRDKRHAEQVS